MDIVVPVMITSTNPSTALLTADTVVTLSVSGGSATCRLIKLVMVHIDIICMISLAASTYSLHAVSFFVVVFALFSGPRL